VLHFGAAADGKVYPITRHSNAETGGGQLQNLGMLFRSHAVAVGDVVALQPAEQEGRTVLRFQVWKEDSEVRDALGLSRVILYMQPRNCLHVALHWILSKRRWER